MSDPQEFLQVMYKEQYDQARQHEIMRQQSTSLILTLSATIAAVTGAGLSATTTPLFKAGAPWVVAVYALLGWVIVKLAQLGEGLSMKHYERNRLHVARARQYRKRLTDLFPSTDYSQANTDADKDHKARWIKDELDASIIASRLHKYWIDIFSFVRYLGIALIVLPVVLAISLTAFMHCLPFPAR